jgi:hypothetical protein
VGDDSAAEVDKEEGEEGEEREENVVTLDNSFVVFQVTEARHVAERNSPKNGMQQSVGSKCKWGIVW